MQKHRIKSNFIIDYYCFENTNICSGSNGYVGFRFEDLLYIQSEGTEDFPGSKWGRGLASYYADPGKELASHQAPKVVGKKNRRKALIEGRRSHETEIKKGRRKLNLWARKCREKEVRNSSEMRSSRTFFREQRKRFESARLIEQERRGDEIKDQPILVSGGYGSEVVRACGGRGEPPRDTRRIVIASSASPLVVRVGVREVLDHELDRLERPLKLRPLTFAGGNQSIIYRNPK